MKRVTRSSTVIQTSSRSIKKRISTTNRTSSKTMPDDDSNTARKRSASSDVPSAQGIAKRFKGEAVVNSVHKAESPTPSSSSPSGRSEVAEPKESKPRASKVTLSEKKWQSWSKDAHSSPFQDFARPTENECRQPHRILEDMHGDTVRKNFEYT
jgi:hypothetical protein